MIWTLNHPSNSCTSAICYEMLRSLCCCLYIVDVCRRVSNILFSNIFPEIMTRFLRRGHARWTCYAYIVSSRHVYYSWCVCLLVEHWEFSMHFVLLCFAWNSIFNLLLSSSQSSHCHLSSNWIKTVRQFCFLATHIFVSSIKTTIYSTKDKAFYIAYGWNIVVSLVVFVCLRNF